MLKSFIIYSVIITGLVFIESNKSIFDIFHLSALLVFITSPIFMFFYCCIEELNNSPRSK
jgi:hypothetical protein